ASFAKILPEYKAAPQITRERLYIETMERVLSNTRKVIATEKSNNMLLLPLDQAVNDPAKVQQNVSSDTAVQKMIRQNQSTPRRESSTYNGSDNLRGDT
ncbi:protease modulator HflK, partial [Enterobacter hormaechei]|nr:protease modulator HflK [Enterobacter hormaechei]